MQENDPVKQMVEGVRLLVSPGNDEASIQAKQDVLEGLHDYVEDIDRANDFHKIGGLTVMSGLLHSDHEGLRWRCAELLAALVQNNPFCQEEVLKAGFLPMLLNVLDTDSSSLVRTKCLYAVSCLTRDVAEAQQKFVELDGFSVLMRAMQGEEEKLQTKAVFMLERMCASQDEYKDQLCDIGMVEQLVGLLQGEHKDFHEHVINALVLLSQGHDRCIQECRRPQFNLEKNLKDRIQRLKGQPEYEEEVKYSEDLLKLVFDREPTATTVDR